MGRDGRADAVCFTPFNKNAMRLAHPVYDDEISFSADVVGLDGPASEFNVLDGLWNARVTSHISLAEVASRCHNTPGNEELEAPRKSRPQRARHSTL